MWYYTNYLSDRTNDLTLEEGRSEGSAISSNPGGVQGAIVRNNQIRNKMYNSELSFYSLRKTAQ